MNIVYCEVCCGNSKTENVQTCWIHTIYRAYIATQIVTLVNGESHLAEEGQSRILGVEEKALRKETQQKATLARRKLDVTVC